MSVPIISQEMENKDGRKKSSKACCNNSRWQWKMGKKAYASDAGHAAGSKNVEKICAAAWDMGIEYVTMYAFSTENWSRPKEEVDALMKLLHSYLKDCLKTSKKNNMQVRVIGDISKTSRSA